MAPQRAAIKVIVERTMMYTANTNSARMPDVLQQPGAAGDPAQCYGDEPSCEHQQGKEQWRARGSQRIGPIPAESR